MKQIKNIKLNRENMIFFGILIGIILLSIGIYLIGIKAGDIGKLFTIFGSLLFYASVVSLVFII
jgi:hypothetical protein